MTKKKDAHCRDIVIQSLAATGLVNVACRAAGITTPTFYDWKKKDPSFSSAVARALEEYREEQGKDLVSIAQDRVFEYLTQGTVEHWTKKKRKEFYEIAVDPETKQKVEVLVNVEVEESENTVRRPCPPVILDRILPTRMSGLDAVKVAIEEGLLPQEHSEIVAEGLKQFYEFIRTRSKANGNSGNP
jgi:hypothetical protein